MREPAPPGCRVLYLNPIFTQSDLAASQRVNSGTTISLWTKTVQETNRADMVEWKKGLPTYFIAVNSAYYFGTSVCKFFDAGDQFAVCNHSFLNDTTVGELPELLTSCSYIAAGNYQVSMKL